MGLHIDQREVSGDLEWARLGPGILPHAHSGNTVPELLLPTQAVQIHASSLLLTQFIRFLKP